MARRSRRKATLEEAREAAADARAVRQARVVRRLRSKTPVRKKTPQVRRRKNKAATPVTESPPVRRKKPAKKTAKRTRSKTPARKAAAKAVPPAKSKAKSKAPAAAALQPSVHAKISTFTSTGTETKNKKSGGTDIHFNIWGLAAFAVSMALTNYLDMCTPGSSSRLEIPGVVDVNVPCTSATGIINASAAPAIKTTAALFIDDNNRGYGSFTISMPAVTSSVVFVMWLLNARLVLPVVEAAVRYGLLVAGYKTFRRNMQDAGSALGRFISRLELGAVCFLGAAVLAAACAPTQFAAICDAVGSTVGNWKTDLDIDFGTWLGDDSWAGGNKAAGAADGESGATWMNWLASVEWISYLSKLGADAVGSSLSFTGLSPAKALLAALPFGNSSLATGPVGATVTAAIDEGLPLSLGLLLLLAGDRALPHVVLAAGVCVALITAGNIVPLGMRIGFGIAQTTGPLVVYWGGAVYGFLTLYVTYGMSTYDVMVAQFMTGTEAPAALKPISPLSIKGATATMSASVAIGTWLGGTRAGEFFGVDILSGAISLVLAFLLATNWCAWLFRRMTSEATTLTTLFAVPLAVAIFLFFAEIVPVMQVVSFMPFDGGASLVNGGRLDSCDGAATQGSDSGENTWDSLYCECPSADWTECTVLNGYAPLWWLYVLGGVFAFSATQNLWRAIGLAQRNSASRVLGLPDDASGMAVAEAAVLRPWRKFRSLVFGLGLGSLWAHVDHAAFRRTMLDTVKNANVPTNDILAIALGLGVWDATLAWIAALDVTSIDAMLSLNAAILGAFLVQQATILGSTSSFVRAVESRADDVPFLLLVAFAFFFQRHMRGQREGDANGWFRHLGLTHGILGVLLVLVASGMSAGVVASAAAI